MFSKLSDSLVTEMSGFHAVESYRPSKVLPSVEMEFAHWTERVSGQSEFVAARELAGLPDTNLSALAAEFEKTPRRRRTDVLRHGYLVGVFALLGAALCGLGHFAVPFKGEGLGAFDIGMVLCLLLAFLGAVLGGMGSLRYVNLDIAYGRLGLYVSPIDEQHPWLYRTLLLMSNKAANDYRERVLAERGVLRGMDYLMMREVASAHESVQLTQTAHSVVRAVQGGKPARGVAAPDGAPVLPSLTKDPDNVVPLREGPVLGTE